MGNNRLLEEAKRIVKENEDRHTTYIGHKPWFLRVFTKMKISLVATSIVGMSGFGMISSPDFNIGKHLPSFDKHEMSILVKQDNNNEVKNDNILTLRQSNGEIKQNAFVSEIDLLKKQYPDVDYNNLKNQRDVAKSFLGENNFIALAAEMEGFRGDLHKDPATGLNIGFGYNISKRVAASETTVVKDLLAIGLDNEKVEKIIKLAKKPQNQLTNEIKKFNNELSADNNQLISITQGVALLKRTQSQYEQEAKAAFSTSFNKMGKNQQEVLTYAAYKAGADALSKYKKAIKKADAIYNNQKNKGVTNSELKNIAQELSFFYMKNGKEMVLDERASLIAHTFVTPDYLAIQIGKTEDVKSSPSILAKNKIDFSHLVLAKNDNVDKEAVLKSLKDKINKNRIKIQNNRHSYS